MSCKIYFLKDLTSPPPSTLAWRTDIEGLRGIAVLLVVLYHAEVPGFSGGYVGVDVFFVLSGYLITGILVKEVEETGRVDLLRFYARRARRLLPAAALLLACVGAFAFVYYAPLAQIDLAKTALASAAYVSNLFFGLRATDYLAVDAETNPLLHMWSLSVEEQFYLFWPALVLGLLVGLSFRKPRRTPTLNRRRLVWGIVAVATASFALTLLLNGVGWTHWAFFSSPTRVWEFALGGLAALVPSLELGRRSFAHVLGWLGLAAVILAGSLYTARTPFPGWTALLPVLGTVFVLRAGTAEVKKGADRGLALVLSWSPLRFFGRLSYSWYLWHWPALVFAREYGDLTPLQTLAVLTLSLGLAALSYRFVENPARRSRTLGRTVYGATLLGALALLSISLSASWWGVAAAQSRSPEQRRYIAAQEDKPTVSNWRCTVQRLETRLADCNEGPADATFTVALYGDSHAAQWAPALQEAASRRGWRLLYFLKVGCPGIDIMLFAQSLGRDYTECDVWREAALERMKEVRPDLVVMSSFSHYGVLDSQDWRVGSEAIFADLAAIAESVVVLRDSPLPEGDVPACLSRKTWRRTLGLDVGERSCDFPARNWKSVEVFEAQQEAAREFRNVHLLDLTDVICPEGVCVVQTEERILFRDYNHLTASYVRSLSGRLERAFGAVTKGEL